MNTITSGVPQVALLGPSLFLIFMDDLACTVTASEIIMYADDTMWFHALKDKGNVEKS